MFIIQVAMQDSTSETAAITADVRKHQVLCTSQKSNSI